ncbi:MAG: hypothetical protein ACW99J_18085, partial [Candidatus Thorarchaeota archaeon]
RRVALVAVVVLLVLAGSSQSSGPSFDLTGMPGFSDLVSGTEPINRTLELRVGVTDPDGVSTVIGSYKNSSETEWTNVTMVRDMSYADDYVAEPLNYTIVGAHFLVVWDIIFYSNDTLDNWATSELFRMSVSRQGERTDPDNTVDPITVLLVVLSSAALFSVSMMLLFYGRRKVIRKKSGNDSQ